MMGYVDVLQLKVVNSYNFFYQNKQKLSRVVLSPNARWNIQDDHAHITTRMFNM
jgi:hypothetical protein